MGMSCSYANMSCKSSAERVGETTRDMEIDIPPVTPQTVVMDIWTYSHKKVEIRFNFLAVPESRYAEIWGTLHEHCEKHGVLLGALTHRLQAIAVITSEQYSTITHSLRNDKTLVVRCNDHR